MTATCSSDDMVARPLPPGMRSCPAHPRTGQIVYALDLDVRYCARCLDGFPADGYSPRPKTEVLRDCRYGTVLTTKEQVAEDLGILPEAVVSILPGFVEIVV